MSDGGAQWSYEVSCDCVCRSMSIVLGSTSGSDESLADGRNCAGRIAVELDVLEKRH